MPTDDFDDETPARTLTPRAGPVIDDHKREALADALRERFDMSAEDAQEIAQLVADVFADQPEVNDETLEPTVRSIFYTLEAKKLLSFRREEYTWENGERRRGFWWRLRFEELEKKPTSIPVVSDEDVYKALPSDAWRARQNA